MKFKRMMAWSLCAAMGLGGVPAPAVAEQFLADEDNPAFEVIDLDVLTNANDAAPAAEGTEGEPHIVDLLGQQDGADDLPIAQFVPEGQQDLLPADESAAASSAPASAGFAEALQAQGQDASAGEEEVVLQAQATPSATLWKRLSGDNRYITMSAIVSEKFSSSTWAVVASGANYPDALVAASVAGANRCPIIITGRDSLSIEASTQLARLGVREVYIMGGTSTVSAQVEQQIANMGIGTRRIEGTTRLETSVKAMQAARGAGSASNTVVVASGFSFADALSIGPWAYAKGAPIVLANADGTLTNEEVAAIKSDGNVKRIVIVGGTSSVSEGIQKKLGSTYSYVRLAGEDRYDTNRDVVEWSILNGLSWTAPAIASGQQYPDALVGAALCGANASPIVLYEGKSVAMLMGHTALMTRGYVLGGGSAVPNVAGVTAVSTLDGVDISGWNEGVNVEKLKADFVIIKATEGLDGTVWNPSYKSMANAAIKSGKLVGFYHYANGLNPVEEANSFYEAIKDYKGRAIACLDWEVQGNKLFDSGLDAGWCRQFLDRLQQLFGGTPFLYTSKNFTNKYGNWSTVAARYPLWGAQYAYDDRDTVGYETSPWQSSEDWGAWGWRPMIFQYSSLGVFQSDLDALPKKSASDTKDGSQSMISDAPHYDFNKFYGSASLWQLFQQ